MDECKVDITIRGRRLPGERFATGIVLFSLLACGCQGSPGSSPMAPTAPPVLPPPTIVSIEPADAAPGDPITIRGEGLSAEGAAVLFDGVPGEVLSATSTTILAVVPGVPEGERSVVVRAREVSSAPFPFRVSYRASPVIVPVILGISPASAHVGEEITITGANLASNVLFGDVRALVISGTPSEIVAVVPIVASGARTVVVQRGEEASQPFPIEILHSSPRAVSILPNPARAGLWVTIVGQNLAGVGAAVLIDGALTGGWASGAGSMIARIPELSVGSHELQVRVDGESTPALQLWIDDFDASGIYDVRSVVLQSAGSDCPAPGAERVFAMSLVDDRPRLTVRSGFWTLRGSVDSDGVISAALLADRVGPFQGFLLPYGLLRVGLEGKVTRRPGDGRFEIDATIRTVEPCAMVEHVVGPRR
jgi:hypothetical protein